MAVGLLVPCLTDLFAPRTVRAARRLLARLGVEAVVPRGHTCCGQPALTAGQPAEARPVVAHCRKVFRPYEAVVSLGGSCAAALRHLDRLGVGDLRFERPVYEFTEFLVEVLGRPGLGGRWRARVAYHPACHTRRLLGVGEAPLRLLRGVAELEVVAPDDREACCGFGGVFAVTYPELSGALAAAKVEAVLATGAAFVVSTDTSCLLQLAGALRRRRAPVGTLHVAEVLAVGLGLIPPPDPPAAR